MDKTKELFRAKGLKATSQRIIVYDVMKELGHAPVDRIVESVHRRMPTISVASVYNILECLSQNELIGKVLTQDNKIHYDITPTTHHHLYDTSQHRVEDYCDKELTILVANYLSSHKIKGFDPQNIQVQIIGKFNNL